MSALLLALSFGVFAESTLTGDDACHFVGSRFVRTSSTCVSGVCVGLMKRESGTYARHLPGNPAVTCMDARSDVMEFLVESKSPDIHTKSADAQEVIDQFAETVVPILEELAFGIQLERDVVTWALFKFDRFVLTLAAENFQEWRESCVAAVWTSDPLLRMSDLMKRIVSTGLTRSLTYFELRRSLHSAIYFYFDLAALLGTHFLDPSIVVLASRTVFDTDSGYRRLTRREFHPSPTPIGLPETAEEVLILSSALERMLPHYRNHLLADLEVVYYLLVGWLETPESSCKGLMQDQIESAICPQLPRIFRRISSSHARSDSLLRLTGALIEVCRPVISMEARLEARAVLALWDHESRGVGIPVDVTLSSTTPYLWDLGFSIAEPVSARVRAQSLLSGLLGRKVVPVKKADNRVTVGFRDNDPMTPRAFGRALGLAIIHDVDIKFLRLDATVVKMLHPRFRVSAGRLADVAADIAPMTPEMLFHVNGGLEEVLGHGGHEVFSCDEWLALFGLYRLGPSSGT